MPCGSPLPESKCSPNDKADTQDIRTIEKRVTEFYDWLSTDKILLLKKDYRGMCAQIKDYWDRLFCDPIAVETPNGTTWIQPQGTNNVLLPDGFHYPQDPAKPFPGRANGGFAA